MPQVSVAGLVRPLMVVRDPDSRNPAKRSRRVPLLAAAVIAILAGPGMTAFAQADSPNLVGVSCKISGNGMTLESTAVGPVPQTA